MTASEFVAWVEKNAARVTEYSVGGDGSGGKCDCIGLVIGAWRLSGNKWPWVHGSNYTARKLTDNLGKDQPLNLGDFVFKAKEPGDSGYNLPDQYKDGTDLLDYYHIGVVTRLEPLEITHCTSVPGGIKRDTTRGKWHYSGRFSKLTKEVIPVGKAYVTGGKLNLRKTYSKMGSIITQIPNGAEVEILEIVNDDWAKVQYKGYTGYAMRAYLAERQPDPDMSLEEKVERLRILLEDALELIGRG